MLSCKVIAQRERDEMRLEWFLYGFAVAAGLLF